MEGTIKFFHERGYGFIVLPNGAEAFFHASEVSGCADAIAKGDVVEFDLARGPRGLFAQNVHVLKSSEASA